MDISVRRDGRESRLSASVRLFGLMAFVIVCATALFFLPNRPLGDEYIHWGHALAFAKGDWHVDPWLSTWPTMNFVVSLIPRFTGSENLEFGRAAIACFGAFGLLGYLRLLANLHAQERSDPNILVVRALQFFCAPIVLLVCTQIYTDIPALAFLCWAAVGVTERRRWLILVGCAGTVAFRQSHIVWLGFVMVWYFHDAFSERYLGHDTSIIRVCSVGEKCGWYVQRFFALCRHESLLCVGTVLIGIVWLLIVVSSNGVALGVNSQIGHRLSIAGVPNIFFMFVVWFICFLPLVAVTLFTNQLVLTKQQVVFAVAFSFLAATCFVATCPSNIAPEVGHFIRNRVLKHLTSPLGHSVLVVVTLIGALSWYATQFIERVASVKWLLVVAACGYVLPFWLIEQRYYLPAFMFFLAFRKSHSMKAEAAMLAWSLLLSAMLVFQVAVKGRLL